MIFVDESGKRWRRIKLGTRFLSTAVLFPVAILVAASLLYFPN
jgi:hypothetical protein